VTICTQNREHYFGKIENNKMRLSAAGAIAHVLWDEIKNRTNYVELGEFVVMPNHLHGILIINKNGLDDQKDDSIGCRDVACNVPTTTNDGKNEKMAAISPKAKTVSSLIRSYKSAVTKYCNRLGLDFAWQSRFYDHIIRNDESHQRIAHYIKNNPTNWKEDEWY
jgi:REP element-mobilizing transposase RayT